MTITLLLDLDDTLLQTNMDSFIPAYFKALSGALSCKVTPEWMLSALSGGTQAMMENQDPSLTLREVFDANFFPKLACERSDLQAAIDKFYDEDFPSLGGLTKPITEAVSLVDWAFEQGCRVVIATNPLFPLNAIHHRLRWANLPPEKYPFTLITSYETFHFTKEKVAYYPEIMAQLGWPEEPVVMVGDDVEREVKPTQAAGFPVFWVRKPGEIPSALEEVPQGSLGSFRDWLEKTDPNTLKLSFQSPRAILACLRSTPAAISTLLTEIALDKWNVRPALQQWCLTEILCHLRDVESEVNLPRLQRLLTEQDPFIPGAVTDRWVEERRCIDQDGHQALHDFIALRKEMLSLLEHLHGEWAHSARHAIFGRTTMQEQVGFIAGHDRAHIQQIWKILHSNYQ